MKKVKLLGKNFYPKNIKAIPQNISIDGVELKKCTNNSKLIIENNPDSKIEYVEGFILIFQDGVYRAVAHAWNRIGDIYFDATAEVFDNTVKTDAVYSKQYFPIANKDIETLPNLKDGVLPFSDDFIKYIHVMDKLYPVK